MTNSWKFRADTSQNVTANKWSHRKYIEKPQSDYKTAGTLK
jgi:hypothetical protein